MNKFEMNAQQEAAARGDRGPLLIVAGAGTGKTRTLMSRLIHFIESGIAPHRICAITFTNKAAGEMRERLAVTMTIDNDDDGRTPSMVKSQRSRVGACSAPFIGTFHALGAKILREEARQLGRTANFAIFDTDDSFSILRRILKNSAKKKSDEAGAKKESEKPSFFAQKISELKNKPAEKDALKNFKKQGGEKILEVFNKYEMALKENNAFDFDDLIEKPVEIFENFPDALAKHAGRFDALLVDEFQDVSPMQNELIKLLGSAHRNVSVVGDDEQLIYGWRHADLKIFLGFGKDWPKARVAFLEENYRSAGNIIRAASAVAKNNSYRYPKKLWTKNPAGAPIKLKEAADDEEEAEFIAKAINSAAMTINNDGDKNHSHGHGGHSVAILYRTNAQSRAIEQALIRRQIPYKIFGGIKFYERKEIKDIVAAIRYFANKKDSVSKERLEKNLTRRAFSELEAGLLAAKTETTPAELVEIFIKSTDYFDYLERNFTNYAEREENVAELLHFASRFDSLQSFLEEIALVQSTDIPSAKTMTMTNDDDKNSGHSHSPAVHLSTIHLAKGLEFDRVFIAGCSEGLLPHGMSMDKDEQIEEERRLMYVAITRAKKELYLSFYDMPSRFLGEIPNELIEYSAPQDSEASSESGEKYVYLDE